MNKYRNIKTNVGGVTFDSKKEANRWGELLVLQRAGEISDLHRQRGYDLVVSGLKICRYIADFGYIDKRSGALVIEDTKGVRTSEYKLKKKLMLACYGIDILET